MNVVEVSDLRKSYRRFEALRGVSLSVAPGEVFGLLGQNGAGKTTLIKILLGIARPTGGNASLLGESVGNVGVRKRIGYLPEDHNFPLYHSAWTLLDFYGQLLGLSRPDRHKRMHE